MKDLYFYAFNGFSPISKMIKFFTRSKYSHIAVYDSEQKTTIEVWGKLFTPDYVWKYSDLSGHKKGTKIDVYALKVKSHKYYEAMKFYRYLAENKVGYNYIGVIAFVIPMKLRDKEGYFCSEGAWMGLKKAKINHAELIPEWKISPDNFVENILLMGAEKVDSFEL